MKPLLLHDASPLLNLLATGYFAEIAGMAAWQFAICTIVRDEAKKLRDPVTGEMVPIDLSGYFSSGLLRLVELAGEDEEDAFVKAASVLDDGESMSLAIASQRGLPIAMDDKRAIRYAAEQYPELTVWTTPQILQRWSEVTNCGEACLREALRSVEARARYFPAKSHPQWQWWERARG